MVVVERYRDLKATEGSPRSVIASSKDGNRIAVARKRYIGRRRVQQVDSSASRRATARASSHIRAGDLQPSHTASKKRLDVQL
jgi:hypothetical protein